MPFAFGSLGTYALALRKTHLAKLLERSSEALQVFEFDGVLIGELTPVPIRVPAAERARPGLNLSRD
ncbi:MAG TPA: hypothetical protein VG900_12650 [Hyphomicrobiaceae bacterium]|jgi:hypothetical protein|nr:hypothetical protein [Hyphomicrobiaceae bacterium]